MPELDAEQARRRLAGAPVVRLATADERGRPHLVVATFALERAADGDLIHMAVDHKPKRTRNLKRLRNIAVNPWVSVLADHYEDDWSRLWWVRADGRARVSDDPRELHAAAHLLAQRYPQYRHRPPQGPAIVVTVHHWVGWIYSAEDDISSTS
ncbi:TIGR03668 family PPOX class F420-dependent oxidoreductase [Thermomonospora sp. CIF 1]|uniref:TIGR03668 family PPOX class F420-dependent oxidoreductase n=1 Tax=Thermomonospora sp. CIF 1 TaxID=1916083 RepID=UPI000AE9F021|nr:TIGR03668 family PPOX class F420-dependent oxidoreductase [Thermomonospora sp. CIF 1]PKK14459.1 MAG: TIGR03668 family PPOX class F420-dependent oxidoreductase [Thermomonospora sp. CIF 1]